MVNSYWSAPYEKLIEITEDVNGVIIDKSKSRSLSLSDEGRRLKFFAPINFRKLGLISIVEGKDGKNFKRINDIFETLKFGGFEPNKKDLEYLFDRDGNLRDESDTQNSHLFVRLRYDIPCGTYSLVHSVNAESDKAIKTQEEGISMDRIVIGYRFPDDNAIF